MPTCVQQERSRTMKLGRLFILAFFVSSLFSHAQNKEAAGKPAQVASPALATPAPVEGTATDSYVIGASDVLTVTVWKEPTLSGNVLVRPDGMISMPLLGDVQASRSAPWRMEA